LKLIDDELINPNTLYGSWAGAYGNFQFMPSTIKRYAIDYDNNNKIELKSSLNDALASAANYINKIGWKKGQPCFVRVKLRNNINNKYINSSARTILKRLKIKKWKKKGVVNFDGSDLETNLKAALILPDGKSNTPAFLVFENYEKILKWNRSLRFGISVCTLANMIKT
jgi:membrane-bound lytic murein transglycosylase B